MGVRRLTFDVNVLNIIDDVDKEAWAAVTVLSCGDGANELRISDTAPGSGFGNEDHADRPTVDFVPGTTVPDEGI